ncbi:hypothetical protein N0V93_006056 [Gnomoniopsis smithogilvyi]|uniref:Uncharacterized protein n=1 Tax=Gnomoniopsis smithogilvyi TaxID=1191159 RepID=A0A9W8YMK5_9PEZI|nr:hypothetical protein N0V93_006056 [Gnomoniopsis smithogilvyi]
MSTPNTPSGNPISACATPIAAPASNTSVSSIPPSPASQPIQSPESALESQPAPTFASVLQPLPRGRPPKPKPDPPPPTAHWEHVGSAPEQDVWASSASVEPTVHVPLPQSHLQLQHGRSPPEPAYLRGGHLLGGYNTARYAGNPTAHPKFNAGGRVIILTNASNLQAWVEQISYIARSLSCFDELTKRFTSFPQPGTVQLFICETRFATAFRVLEGSISGPVWAYMRVLGLSSIAEAGEGLMSPTPADCFEYAKLAASRMAVPGTPEQPAEERKRMVREILTAQAAEYPGERVYKKGIQWLRLACDSLIKQGDYELAESLYDPLPEWAPRPPGYVEPTIPANGEENLLEPRENCSVSTAEAAHSPDPHGTASIPTLPNPPKLVPEGHKPGKRKRAKKDEGP